ncbi:MAG TPA: YebC/PmpR family DNA-binding transcriptional regulator [Acidimicrobiales bacterium]|nr:YebC/PmpR family DNA-binding transcriptional regulator [Acidimicrobiales bacterium]
MSGHSKWASIKHKKGALDKKRGKLFAKLIKQVEVAARQGGGDLSGNATLRTMVQKARDASVPNDTIERAIKRGTGELEGVHYESITYEGYAPHGVAVYIEVLTDNRNRTSGEIRSIFTKNGGALSEPGAVAWQFARTGVLYVPKSVSEDDLMLVALDAGADDIADDDELWRVTSPPALLPAVRDALDTAGIPVESADVTFLSSTSIALETPEAARAVLKLIDLLDDNDDVDGVYSNFDITEELMQSVEA